MMCKSRLIKSLIRWNRIAAKRFSFSASASDDATINLQIYNQPHNESERRRMRGTRWGESPGRRVPIIYYGNNGDNAINVNSFGDQADSTFCPSLNSIIRFRSRCLHVDRPQRHETPVLWIHIALHCLWRCTRFEVARHYVRVYSINDQQKKEK